MSTILVIWTVDPKFPASDQQPDAVRYAIIHPIAGALLVDATGGQPTIADIDVMLHLDAASQAKAARVAADEVDRQTLLGNSLLMTFINMTPGQIDAWVTANVNNLADAKTALALLAKIVNVAIRSKVRNGT